jgi:2-hydroxychromene-2-carboxylate isomerase
MNTAMAGKVVDFYFDFISPYGFFAMKEVDDFARQHGCRFVWHPMLLGVSILKVMKLPPVPERPMMGDYHLKHAIPRYARRHRLELKRPVGAPPPNPSIAAKCFYLLDERDPSTAIRFTKAIVDAHWLQGRNVLDDAAAVLTFASEAGAAAEEISNEIGGPRAANLLRTAVEKSIARGVFGSPMFYVGDEPFFGVDSMPMLGEWLDLGGW